MAFCVGRAPPLPLCTPSPFWVLVVTNRTRAPSSRVSSPFGLLVQSRSSRVYIHCPRGSCPGGCPRLCLRGRAVAQATISASRWSTAEAQAVSETHWVTASEKPPVIAVAHGSHSAPDARVWPAQPLPRRQSFAAVTMAHPAASALLHRSVSRLPPLLIPPHPLRNKQRTAARRSEPPATTIARVWQQVER